MNLPAYSALLTKSVILRHCAPGKTPATSADVRTRWRQIWPRIKRGPLISSSTVIMERMERACLDREVVQVGVRLVQDALVSAWLEARQQCGVGALAEQADGAVRRAHNHAHPRALAREVQHVQDLVRRLQSDRNTHSANETRLKMSLARYSQKERSACIYAMHNHAWFFIQLAPHHQRIMGRSGARSLQHCNPDRRSLQLSTCSPHPRAC